MTFPRKNVCQNPDLPDTGEYSQLVSVMFRSMPQSWADLESFARLCGLTLDPWEAEAVMKLAGTYRAALSEYNGQSLPPPYMVSGSSMQTNLMKFKKSMSKV